MQMIGKTLLLFGVLGLAACAGNDNSTSGNSDNGDNAASLPKPEAAGGSVTGMPDKPGPGQVGLPDPDTVSPDTPVASDGEPVAPLPGALEPPSPGATGTLPDDLPLPPGEPSPQDAVAVVRDYYASIDAHDYAHAYVLWSDGGRSTGKTTQQFADGFADTASVSAQIDPPGRIDAAAGSRYIKVPVTITATQRDGSAKRYVGSYTLRRAVVDGASAEQRAWRIASADLSEVD
ncbi:MAG: hypothetical protein ACMG5Z_03505 [Luteimonas sp.]